MQAATGQVLRTSRTSKGGGCLHQGHGRILTKPQVRQHRYHGTHDEGSRDRMQEAETGCTCIWRSRSRYRRDFMTASSSFRPDFKVRTSLRGEAQPQQLRSPAALMLAMASPLSDPGTAKCRESAKDSGTSDFHQVRPGTRKNGSLDLSLHRERAVGRPDGLAGRQNQMQLQRDRAQVRTKTLSARPTGFRKLYANHEEFGVLLAGALLHYLTASLCTVRTRGSQILKAKPAGCSEGFQGVYWP